jgi:hypothetical protein
VVPDTAGASEKMVVPMFCVSIQLLELDPGSTEHEDHLSRIVHKNIGFNKSYIKNLIVRITHNSMLT